VEAVVQEALGRMPRQSTKEETAAPDVHPQSEDRLSGSQPVAVGLVRQLVPEAPEEAELVELGLSLPPQEQPLAVVVEEGIKMATTT
jgi:hypothetical protein